MDIEATIKRILVSKVYVEVPVEKIDARESLREALGVDSLGFIELRAQCESTFGVEISDDDFTPENFATVAVLTALIERLSQPWSGSGPAPTAAIGVAEN
jgi:acyl carrier protein